MRRSSILWFAVSASFMFAATASSQSLVELAQKEKARRAEVAKSSEPATVIDAFALSTVEPTSFSAIEVTGVPREESTLEPAEVGRPPLENPNRAAPLPPTRARQTNDRPGRGWSSGSEHPPDARGWSEASNHPPGGRGWSRGGENPPDGRGWSDRPASDRGLSSASDHASSSDRGWTRGGENPTDGRGWSQRPSNP